jgi:phosphoglycerate kinase
MKTLKEVEIAGKRVLVRVDFNVPLDDQGNITDDSRIKGALPTLRHVVDQGGLLIVASHLGRPEGIPVPRFSLAPVAERLGALLNREVVMAPDCIGTEVEKMVGTMQPGDVLLLENLRFHPGEQKNDDGFAGALAALADVYVNDAFAVCHRVNASVAAVTRHVPVNVAGLLLQKELGYFKQALADPRRPLVAVVGGAKVSTKLKALQNMLQHVDKVVVGGAMANTFIRCLGHGVGKSKVEEDLVPAAGEILKQAAAGGVRFYLPVDVVVAPQLEAGAPTKLVPIQEIPEEWMALDIGPATVLLFREALLDARTVIWNGPMGVFEVDAFSRGTTAMANSVASAHALTIVGGGDTDAAVHMAGEGDRISFISTGGGAFLALLEGKTLPGVAALGA